MQIVKHRLYFSKVLFVSFFVSGLLFTGVPSNSLADNSSVTLKTKRISKNTFKSDLQNSDCQLWPEIVKNMPIGNAVFNLSSTNEIAFQYRLANTSERMQHGFQRTCAQTIAITQILFKFASINKPAFHMNNVVAALDIAFIDENGRITDIHLMSVYGLLDLKKGLYSPSEPILYALEARGGYFAELGVKVGDYVDIKH